MCMHADMLFVFLARPACWPSGAIWLATVSFFNSFCFLMVTFQINYLRMYETSLGRPMSADELSDLFLITERTLQRQPILRRNWPIPPSFITQSLGNGLEYRSADGHTNSSDDVSISGKIW